MSGIQSPLFDVINDLAIHSDDFHHTFDVVFHELPNLFDEVIDLSLRQSTSSIRYQNLRHLQKDHRNSDPFTQPFTG